MIKSSTSTALINVSFVKRLQNTGGDNLPVTIDPLSNTANWLAESNQAQAQLGYSVSTADSVNGDGFSDVIVGFVSLTTVK